MPAQKIAAKYVSIVMLHVYADTPEDALAFAKSIRSEAVHGWKHITSIRIRANKPNVAGIPTVEIGNE